MTADQFCFWLQGHFELRADKDAYISEEQVKIIRHHLNLAFVHDIDPRAGDAEHQKLLNAVHQGVKPPFSDKPVMRC